MKGLIMEPKLTDLIKAVTCTVHGTHFVILGVLPFSIMVEDGRNGRKNYYYMYIKSQPYYVVHAVVFFFI